MLRFPNKGLCFVGLWRSLLVRRLYYTLALHSNTKTKYEKQKNFIQQSETDKDLKKQKTLTSNNKLTNLFIKIQTQTCQLEHTHTHAVITLWSPRGRDPIKRGQKSVDNRVERLSSNVSQIQSRVGFLIDLTDDSTVIHTHTHTLK